MNDQDTRRDDSLEFHGRIVKGIGRHAELVVPGNAALAAAPPDWPQQLYPGSLNVRVDVDGYPPEFEARGLSMRVTSLNDAGFDPAFVIPQTAMGNNKLTATAAQPRRGEAQVWRASLSVAHHDIRCWVLRRIGSGLRDQLELVSGEGIRDGYGLVEGGVWQARVQVFGQWR